MFFSCAMRSSSVLQSRVVRSIVEGERIVTDLLHKLLQPGIGLINISELDDAFAHVGCKLVSQRSPSHTDDGKVLRQKASLLEVK